MWGKRKFEINEIYTWVIVLLPLLAVYGFKYAESGLILAMILMGAVSILKRELKISYEYILWLLLMCYILLLSISVFLLGNFEQSPYLIFARSVKTSIYIVLLLTSSSMLLIDYKTLVTHYLRVVHICTVYIFIQTLLWYLLKVSLGGYLPVGLYEPAYAQRLFYVPDGLYRPTSLFYEPAHYFEYVFFAIVFYLFGDGGANNKKIRLAIFISAGVVCSTSTQGIFWTVFIWVLWLLREFFIHRGKVKVIWTIIVFIGLAASILFLMSDYGQEIVGRVFEKDLDGNALYMRAQAWLWLKEMTPLQCVFGNGYGNTNNGYWANWPFDIYCLGLVGTVLIICIFAKSIRDSDRLEIKILLLLIVLINFTNNLFMGGYILFYFSFVYAREKSELTWKIKRENI